MSGAPKRITLFVVLVLIYLATRMFLLTKLPIFVDEAIHIWWGERFLQGDLFRSFNVGKPLEPLLIAPGLLLGMPPLWWARFIHVLAGMGTITFIYAAGVQEFSQRTAVWATLLYIVLPFALFYDRIALAESYVALATSLLIWAIIQLQRQKKPVTWAFIISLILLFGTIAKMPTGVILASIPLSFAIFDRTPQSTLHKKRILTIIYVPLIGFVLAMGLIMAYRVSQGATPGFGMSLVFQQITDVGQKESFWDIMSLNLNLVNIWLQSYLSVPLLLWSILSLGWAIWKGNYRERPLAIFILTTLACFIMVSSIWYPRYLLFLVSPLCLLIGAFVEAMLTYLKNRVTASPFQLATLGAAILLLLPPITQSQTIFSIPDTTALPPIDQYQYITGPASGYGFPETATWLEGHASSDLIITWLIGDYLRLTSYVNESGTITIQQVHIKENGQSQSTEQRLENVSTLVKNNGDVWLVLASETDTVIDSLTTYDLVGEKRHSFPRPGGETAVTIYEITHQPKN